MNVIRVFAFPSHSPGKHVSGVDYPRVIQPMTFLNGYKDDKAIFEVDLWDGEKISPKKWFQMVAGYDIIYFNYTLNDMNFAEMRIATEMHGKKLIMDLDDALWNINPDNSVYKNYEKGSDGIGFVTIFINEADYVTCTNSYLKNIIVNNTQKRHELIKVFPNCVDLKLYKSRPEPKDYPFITITHYGSSSHYADLSDPEFIKGMDMIMDEYPNVTFLTVGSFFQELKMKYGKRYQEEFGATNFLEWAKDKFPKVMEKTDIFVAPLTLNTYNRAKSDIKRSEVATTKRAFVGQNIRQYQEVITDGVDGFLCSTAQEWHDKIKTLIDDPVLRKKMGEAGFERVKQTRQAKDMVKHYAEWFEEILGLDKIDTTK